MSYDLMFTASSRKRIDTKAFREFFHGRPNYQPGERQVLYQNEDTGVYFIFDEPEDGVVSFNLNYFRPHVFGLEAAPELEQFVEAIGAVVGDPQGAMEEEGVFTREGFLRGWNEGNAFAYRAMLKEQTEPIYTWTSDRIQQVWEWNYTRRSLQEELGEDLFVPAIFAIETGGELMSVAIWPPDCPIVLPTVDAVLVPLARREPENQDMGLARWEELESLVAPYAEPPAGGGPVSHRLAFQEWPADIAAFLDRLRAKVENLNGIGLDQILDRELVEQASNS